MKINCEDFRVREASEVSLKNWPTRTAPVYGSNDEYQELLKDHVKKLSAQQELLYASGRYAMLLIFQAMDAAGKDGVIAHVMSGVNPQGCQVFSFKHPSAIELQHDFLWRTTRDLPERGKIGIFNRSYYEEVLIVRVHPRDSARARDCRDAQIGGEKTVWRGPLPLHPATWSGICIATAPASSNSSCTSRKKSSASASSRESTLRTRTGSSAWRTSRSASIGSNT